MLVHQRRPFWYNIASYTGYIHLNISYLGKGLSGLMAGEARVGGLEVGPPVRQGQRSHRLTLAALLLPRKVRLDRKTDR